MPRRNSNARQVVRGVPVGARHRRVGQFAQQAHEHERITSRKRLLSMLWPAAGDFDSLDAQEHDVDVAA